MLKCVRTGRRELLPAGFAVQLRPIKSVRKYCRTLIVILCATALYLTCATSASAAIVYQQGNVNSIETSVSSITVNYTSAQTAGDLNVVVVGWFYSAAVTINSVTDTKGNVYSLAVGPTIFNVTGGGFVQSIYYAPNIVAAAAGANTVTVTFSGASDQGSDTRVLEYSGIATSSPFDVGVGATGMSTAVSSGAVTTTNANDLLVGADLIGASFGGVGTGYTQRILTSNTGDLVEDEIVTASGSYSATSIQSPSSDFIMQIAAFKAASTGGDTTPPSAPTAPSATAASATQMNVSWTASTDNVGVTGYRVERCSGASCTTFAQIGTPTATSFSDTGLTPSTSYSYRIRATDAAGNLSAYSSTVSASTSADTTAPTAPTSPTATAASSTQINVSWTASTDNVGVTGYIVQRCSGASCTSFAQVATPTTTTLSDTGLTAATSYSYRIQAKDAAGNLSAFSTTVSATTSAGGSAPIAFVQSNVTVASGTLTSVTLTFSSAQTAGDLNVVVIGPSYPTAAGSISSVTDGKGNAYVLVGTQAGPAADVGFTQSIYYAANIVAASAGSNTVTVTFSSSAEEVDLRILEYSGIATSSPLDVTVGANGTNTTLVNSGSATTTNANDLLIGANEIGNSFAAVGSGYTQRILTASTGDLVEDEIVTATGSYSATSTQSPAGDWIMQMVAFKKASGGTGDTTPPTAPTAPSATAASATQINVSWTASTDNVGVTGYIVQRCSGASCTTFAQVATPTTTTLSDTGLTASTSYSYRIQAKDAAGNLSAFSSTVSATTSAASDTTPPTAPTAPGATATSATQINVSWTASTDNVGVTGYIVQRCSGASCTTFAQVATPTTTTLSDTGLTASTSYSYRIQAKDAAGNLSAFSSTVSATTSAGADTTPPSAPSALTATAVSSTQINLTWAASTDNVAVTGYAVQRCSGASCSNFTALASSTTNSFFDSGLTASTSYSYRVQATDAAANLSAFSNTATTSSLPASTASALTYGYDSLARLVQVNVAALNLVENYTYDASGNVTSMMPTPITQLSITNSSATQAGPGASITIYGSGFSATPSSNTVTINGAAATVTSATSSQLVVTVPSGATSGPIKVTTGSISVTSTTNFSVTAATAVPTISGFSPSAATGTSTIVTVSGTGFSTTAAKDKVLINGSPAQVTAATATALTVIAPSDSSSGPITVVTPYGSATSSSYFIIPVVGTPIATAVTSENGTAASLTDSAAGGVVVAFFNGVASDTNVKVAFQGATAQVEVVDPHGQVIGTGTAPGALVFSGLTSTGVYSAIYYGNTATGTVKVSVTTAKVLAADLSWSNETEATPASSVNPDAINFLGTTQQAILTFDGALNQLTQFDIKSISGTWTASLVNSSGNTLWTSSSFSAATTLSIPALPADDSYSIVLDPGLGGGSGSITYSAGIVAPSTLSAGGTVLVSGGGPNIVDGGPVAKITFSGTAGQFITLDVGANLGRGFYYFLNFYSLQGGTQTCINNTCGPNNNGGVSRYVYGPLPITGTYIFYMQFASTFPSTVTAAMYPSTALTVGAAPLTVVVDEGDISWNAITFTPTQSGSRSFLASPASCLGSWELLNSSGAKISSGDNVTSGSAGIGSLSANTSYVLLFSANNFSEGGGSSGFWSPNNVNCSVSLQ